MSAQPFTTLAPVEGYDTVTVTHLLGSVYLVAGKDAVAVPMANIPALIAELQAAIS